jgi:hypothetical protein
MVGSECLKTYPRMSANGRHGAHGAKPDIIMGSFVPNASGEYKHCNRANTRTAIG